MNIRKIRWQLYHAAHLAAGQHHGLVTLHSEAIWGVMIALVFFAIFVPHDENKSWWGRPKCQKKIFFKNIFEIFLSKIKYLKNIFDISKGKQHFWS